MAAKTEKRRRRDNRNPVITAISNFKIESYSEKGIKKTGKVAGVYPGKIILISGRNFSKSPDKISVMFEKRGDETSFVKPLPSLSFPSKLLAIVPMQPGGRVFVSIVSNKLQSNKKSLTIYSLPKNKKPVGTITRDFFNTVGETTFLVNSAANLISSKVDTPEILNIASNYLDDLQKGILNTVRVLESWLPLQANQEFEPLRTIERFDEMISISGTAQHLMSFNAEIVKSMNSVASSVINSDTLSGFGFILTEGKKLLEGIENYLERYSPSLSAGEFIAVDVSFNPGKMVSTIASVVDIVAQVISKIAELLKGNPIEAKLDKIGPQVTDCINKLSKLDKKLDKIETKNDKAEQKLDNLEVKNDRANESIDNLEIKLDKLEVKSDRNSEQIGILEVKNDNEAIAIGRLEEKLDKVEIKEDQSLNALEKLEEKVDKVEIKNDKEEQKLDKLESKADKAEEKLDKIETKNDKIEEKLDKIEIKNDKMESKLDKIETKNDKIESKLDKIEIKNDNEEHKLDKLEAKSDSLELKLDKIESKIDYLEPKIDKTEIKLDSLPRFFPDSETSIAEEDGGGGNVSALSVANKILDGKIYVKAAKNIIPQNLSDPLSWTQNWIDFDFPVQARLPIQSVSVDLQYVDNSNDFINGLILVRDSMGKIFNRSYQAKTEFDIDNPIQWTEKQNLILIIQPSGQTGKNFLGSRKISHYFYQPIIVILDLIRNLRLFHLPYCTLLSVYSI